MKTVLNFMRRDTVRAPLIEVARTHLAESLGVSLRTVPFDVSPSDAAQLIRFWSPSGCIVNNDRLPPEIFASVPTVFLHRDDPNIPPGSAFVTFDEQAVAEAAARELLSLDLKTYAFVPTFPHEHWCECRESSFRRIIALNGCSTEVFAPSKTALTRQSRQQTELSKWIRGLPRPAGIFAANDRIAQTALNVCGLLELKVPNDVVVVGADNIEHICECTHPSLSSVAFNWLEFDGCVLESLNLLIDGKPVGDGRILVPPHGVVRRASSMRSKRIDHHTIAALDMIRRRACGALTAAEVAAVFPCGRRMAEMRFRAATGHSILEEIREVRRMKAQEMTSVKRLPRDTIAAACGYASWSSIHRLLAETEK